KVHSIFADEAVLGRVPVLICRRHVDAPVAKLLVLALGVESEGVLGVRNRWCAEEERALIVEDRKSTRLNSSHVKISYAVFCLKSRHPPRLTLFPYTRSSDLKVHSIFADEAVLGRVPVLICRRHVDAPVAKLLVLALGVESEGVLGVRNRWCAEEERALIV